MILNHKWMHFIWVGSELPERFEQNLQVWRELHPDWEVILWDDSMLEWLQHRDLYDDAEKYISHKAEAGQFRADIARYEILHKHGGFYADIDSYPLKSINDALEGHAEFAVREDRSWVANTFLGADPAHPLFSDLLDGLRQSIISKADGLARPNKLCGPQYLTPIWRFHEGYEAPTSQWLPYSYHDVKRNHVPTVFSDDVYVVHEWNNMRRRFGRG